MVYGKFGGLVSVSVLLENKYNTAYTNYKVGLQWPPTELDEESCRGFCTLETSGFSLRSGVCCSVLCKFVAGQWVSSGRVMGL